MNGIFNCQTWVNKKRFSEKGIKYALLYNRIRGLCSQWNRNMQRIIINNRHFFIWFFPSLSSSSPISSRNVMSLCTFDSLRFNILARSLIDSGFFSLIIWSRRRRSRVNIFPISSAVRATILWVQVHVSRRAWPFQIIDSGAPIFFITHNYNFNVF